MKEALEAVPGVRTATVDFDTKEARIVVSDKKVKVEALIAAIKKAGYKASPKTKS